MGELRAWACGRVGEGARETAGSSGWGRAGVRFGAPSRWRPRPHAALRGPIHDGQDKANEQGRTIDEHARAASGPLALALPLPLPREMKNTQPGVTVLILPLRSAGRAR